MKIEVSHGKFGYSNERIIHEDISFDVSNGQILTILGPNGIGKTTLLKCITGLVPWMSGETLVDGEPMKKMKHTAFWKRIGYVPQSTGSVFAYSVLDMVLLGRASHMHVYSTPSAEDYDIAMDALEQVGIAHMYKKPCNNLSGGEFQLVMVARALASKPEIIILDEPESHLDFKNQMLIIGMLEKIVRDQGLGCIVNTHYPEHALRLGDISLMLGPKLPYLFGPTKEIITEENLSKYFGVKVKMLSFDYKDKDYCSIIPLELT